MELIRPGTFLCTLGHLCQILYMSLMHHANDKYTDTKLGALMEAMVIHFILEND